MRSIPLSRRSPAPRRSSGAALALLAAALLVPESTAQREGDAALRAARGALGRGEMERAAVHVERALAAPDLRQEAALVLAELGGATSDRDAVARAARLWLRATLPAEGRSREKAPRGAFELEAKEGMDAADALALQRPAEVAKLRAAAALAELARKREEKGSKEPIQLLTAAWLRRAGLDLVQGSAAERTLLRRLAPEVNAPSSAHAPVLKALDRIGTRALSNGDPGLAVEIGRAIHGLAVQADFKDLRGKRPSGMGKWRARGAKLMGEGRAALAKEAERPWTVDELEWLATEEGEAFTRERSDFAAPGVAISPNGLYRIETDCGHGTLLAAARTVELHHARLVSQFGEDPFVSPDGKVRQGLVRIVPDPSGLEAEGAPYFWVGGFQSGDLTVVRHSMSSEAGLGRLLTHELTHRFDGALHRGIPAWLAEGRAVWTGAAYGDAEEDEFIRDFVVAGSITETLVRGYHGAGSLRTLVSGEPDDYRQNYAAGNALYTFLMTWYPGEETGFDDGDPVFRERLIAFEDSGKHARAGSGLLDEFIDTFCDGREGRPASFEDFAALFGEFARAFDPLRPGDVAKRYRRDAGGSRGREWIYDEPTWTWDWVRAEPTFGQNQARVAGELLAEHGRADDALRAFVWARAVDGPDLRVLRGLEALLEPRAKRSPVAAEALFAVRGELEGLPHGLVGGVPQRSFGESLDLDLAAIEGAVAESLRSADSLDAAGAPREASRQRRTARRLLRFLGRTLPGEIPEDGADAASIADADAVQRAGLELGNWVEESLTGVDERRRPGLYLVEKDGGVLVGRNKPRNASGRFDRGGGGRAFVRGDRWLLPGTYRIRTQIRFTTGYNTAQVVLGYRARDKNVRLTLTAGDFLYSIGEEDKEPEFDKVSWRFAGMRARDGGLPGSQSGGAVDLKRSATAVDLELLVEGPRVSAWIDGRYVGSYHTIDSLPIEGHVGFGTLNGAIRVAPPVITREDGDAAGWLDLEAGVGPNFEGLKNVTVRLPAGTTLPSCGVLLLWIPAQAKADPTKGRKGDDDANIGRARRSARQLLKQLDRDLVAQPLVVALPARLQASLDVAAFLAELEALAGGGLPLPRIVFHEVDAGDISSVDDGRRWVMFIDPHGIARAVQPYVSATAMQDGPLGHWLTVFRDHGQPSIRELPDVVREEELDEGGEEDVDGEDG